MKILCAIMGCNLHAVDGHHDAIRSTWGADLNGWADLKFFVGRGAKALKSDEVYVDCDDDKNHLIWKVEGILQYAIQNGYSTIFKVNTNTYVNVDELKKRGHEHADYAGAPVGNVGEIYAGIPGVYAFIQGSASWLSSRAAEILLAGSVADYAVQHGPGLLRYVHLISPYPHSEDLWIGQVLAPHLVKLSVCTDPGYTKGPLTYWSQSNHIKLYKLGEWMTRLHQAKGNTERMAEINNSYPKGWNT